jgi:hypothetical protein
MMMSGAFATEWEADEKRESKFVFIGRTLPKTKLTEGFLSCIVPDDGALRFPVGAAVLAMVGSGEQEGGGETSEDEDGETTRTHTHATFSLDEPEEVALGHTHINDVESEHTDGDGRQKVRDELSRDLAKLTKWREEKLSEWESDPEGKLRKKYPDRQALESWMDTQCEIAVQRKTYKNASGGKASNVPAEGGNQAQGGQKATKREILSPWAKAKVLKHWDQGRAYRLKLTNGGREVWAPIDSDLFIKSDEGAARV